MIEHQVRAALSTLFLLFLLAMQGDMVAGTVEIPLEQADGSLLILDGPAESLVTLSPHLTELVFSAGAGELIDATVEFSEFPDIARDIPRIGDAFRLDIERIAALHPDLVIAWDSGNPRPAIEQLRSLGIPVWSVEIREMTGIPQTIESIGRATGYQQSAARAAREFRERQALLVKQHQHEETLDYFYQVDARPLFTINGEHLISKGLSLCGGRNVFETEQGLAFQVAHESVVVSNPDVLFAPWLEGQANPLADWKSWTAMQAVQNDALILLNADQISRATPRLLDSLEQACEFMQQLRARSKNK